MRDIEPPKNFKPKYRKPRQPNFLARLFKRDPKSKKDLEIKKKQKQVKQKTIKVGSDTGFDLFLTQKKPTTSKALEFTKRTAVLQTPKKKVRSRRIIKKSRPVNFSLIFLAFLVALFLVLFYFMRSRIPFLAYYFQVKHNIQKSFSSPSEVSFTPEKPAADTLGFYARQNKDKIELLTVDSVGESKVIFSFIGSSIQIDSIAESPNYIAYIDNEGLKLYSFKTKTTDLVLASTQIAKIERVYISPEEHYLAFFVVQNKQHKLFTYKISDAAIRDRNFVADNLIFGTKNILYYSNGISFFWYDYEKNDDPGKITDFNNPTLSFYKTADSLFFVTGKGPAIDLWQINESTRTANEITNINLTFDYSPADFGLAKKDNNLYLSLAGQTLLVDLTTKEKKDFSFNLTLYKLLSYNKNFDCFYAFKKPNGLDEYSLIIFKSDAQSSIFESSIESKIIYLP